MTKYKFYEKFSAYLEKLQKINKTQVCQLVIFDKIQTVILVTTSIENGE